MADAEILFLEPWLDKAGLAELLKVGERWIEYRVTEGLPCAMIGGRRKFKLSQVQPWLEAHGHWENTGDAA